MGSSTPAAARGGFRPRDYGLSSGASAGVAGVLLYSLAKPVPDVVWRDDMAAATALAAVAVLIGATVAAALAGGHHLIIEAMAAILVTVLFYALVQGVSLWVVTSESRHAAAVGDDWGVVGALDYEVPPWHKEFTSPRGSSYLAVEGGRYLVGISSTRDATQPAHVDGKAASPVLRDFYFEADVEYVQGPSDGYCGLMFGKEADEHWWAVVFGRRSLTVTQNPGSLPHRYIYDPDDVKALRPDRKNRLAILKQGGDLSIFLNGRTVTELHDLAIADGTVWLAAQSKSRPIWVRCAFDNLLLRGTTD